MGVEKSERVKMRTRIVIYGLDSKLPIRETKIDNFYIIVEYR